LDIEAKGSALNAVGQGYSTAHPEISGCPAVSARGVQGGACILTGSTS